MAVSSNGKLFQKLCYSLVAVKESDDAGLGSGNSDGYGGEVSVAAQTSARPWQRLDMPTVERVRGVWAAPPAEYGPEPYYGMNGAVTLETVQRDLDTMKSRWGFHAV